MSDWSELSSQESELNYILKKLGKRQTVDNREILVSLEKEFKELHGGQRTKNYTKEEFYNWLQSNRASELKKMQNNDLQR